MFNDNSSAKLSLMLEGKIFFLHFYLMVLSKIIYKKYIIKIYIYKMISTFRIGLNGLKTNSFFFKHYQAIKKVYSYRYSSKKLYELKDSKFS